MKYSSHSTPLLEALSVLPVSALVNLNAVALLESCMTSNSATGTFYSYFFKNKPMVKHSLIERARVFFLAQNNLNFISYVCGENTIRNVKKSYFVRYGENGMVDSIRGLIASYNNENRYTLQLLLNTI